MENPQNQSIFSVSDLSHALKSMVEGAFSRIKLKGEISGLKIHSSGHAYFSLKDQNSVIDGVCWRGTVSKLSTPLEEGAEVIAHGRVTTYPARSKYQMVVENIELEGVGALMKLLQERKEKFLREGLFEAHHKKPLPFMPTLIGVVTSPTGAVIQDILHRIRDRFPCHVKVWPVAVQGTGAASQVAQAIRGFNAQEIKPDVLIVARGGGSLEDLWAFNEEEVVRAAFESTIPLISAVGHETDTTLIDFVSDQRAPTPTAAAEMAVPVLEDLRHTLTQWGHQLSNGLKRSLQEKILRVDLLKKGLGNPERLIEERMQYVDEREERLTQNIRHLLERRTQTLLRHGELLQSYSYKKTLERGFALVQDKAGKPLSSAQDIKVGTTASLTFHDGTRSVEVIS